MTVPFGHVLILAALLFAIGLGSVLARRTLIMILIGVEIMVSAAVLVLVAASAFWQQLDGQLFVLFLLTTTAAEVAIALALVVTLRRRTGTTDADAFSELRG
ncbi:MAG: NADH-quinone oxidoreductase subunit NuoK [Desulfuromonadaceae bacterium]|nr:NADH-quinone oxidoreductase subunit NuoK [Desulfuromonadaceae bacterium]